MKRMLTNAFRTLTSVFAITTAVGLTAQTAPELKVKAKMNFELNADAALSPLGLFKSGVGVGVFRGYDATKGPEKFIDIPPVLQQYDRAKMLPGRTITPNMKGGKWKLALEAVEPMGGKLMMVATSTDTTDGAVQVLVAQIDPDLTKLNGPFTQICRFEHMRKPPRKFRDAQHGIPYGLKTALSPDSSKILAWTPELTGDEVHPKHVFIAFDKNMQLLWYDLVKSPMEASRTDVLAAVIDNDGKATVMIKSTFGEIKFKNAENTFSNKLVTITEDGVKENAFAPGEGQYAKDAYMICQANGAVTCAGTVGQSDKRNQLTPGIFFSTITDGAPTTTVHEVEGETRLSDLQCDGFVAHKGGYYVVVQKFWLKWPPLPSTATEKSYESIDPIRMHDNVWAFSLGTDGGVKWQTKFTRQMRSEEHDAGHVFAGQYDGQLFLLMLDDEANIDLRKKDQVLEPKPTKAALTTFTTFDDQGKFRTKTVRTGEYFDAILGTEFIRINDAEYIAFAAENPGTTKQVPMQLLLVKATGK